MTLASQLVHQLANPTITQNERARLRCQLAKELEESGNLERAREAMGEVWARVGETPIVQDYDQITAAEVFLRVGVLTSSIGSAKQIEGAQETAKNLISQGISRFAALNETEKVAEAQTDLAICYWRQGAFDEARVILGETLYRLTGVNSEVKTIALLRSAIVERTSNRHNEALRLLTEAVPLIEESTNNSLKGKFHNQFALVLRFLSAAEGRDDYRDRALIEYAAASYHFEQAGHTRYQACVENNLGFLFSTIGKYYEAHDHLDRAQALFTSLKDNAHLAGVDETRARVFLAEGRVADAEKLVRAAVQALEKGGEQSLLAEALTTQGVALARLGRHTRARLTLQRAVEVAEQAGDVEGAGQAALTIIEELGEQLTLQDVGNTYECAAELLAASRHPGSKDRLLACARRVLFLLGALSAPPAWEGFSFDDTVRRYEARLIEQSLKDAGGVITRAARLLGLRRQSLSTMLHSRHPELLSLRTPVEPRKSSLMFRRGDCEETQRVTILHVEDSRVISDAVRETLEMEGWEVEMCPDGAAAMKLIEGDTHFDLLLFDNQLPDTDGVELVRRTRELAHRQQTPIIMLAASYVEREARRAGANAFLRKPQDVAALSETIARLLARKPKQV